MMQRLTFSRVIAIFVGVVLCLMALHVARENVKRHSHIFRHRNPGKRESAGLERMAKYCQIQA